MLDLVVGGSACTAGFLHEYILPGRTDPRRAARRSDGTLSEPWSDSLTANPGQRLTVPDSLTALTALSLTV